MASYERTYYEILEIQQSASDDDIRKAYRRLALKHRMCSLENLFCVHVMHQASSLVDSHVPLILFWIEF
jgi:preprotein translocase subunit Sec63